MKKDFKTRIAEVAAKIADIDEKVDKAKINLPTAYRNQANSAIAVPGDLAALLLDIVEELKAYEPSMQDIDKKAGWNMIMQKLKDLAGIKKGETDAEVPDVSADDMKDAEKMEMPKLQEAFNRINRK
jgi:hypothetical protein